MGVKHSEEKSEIIRRYSALAPHERLHLLAGLVYWFSLEGRDGYVEAGNTTEGAVVRLRAINEVMQVLSAQLLRLTDNGEGYPDDAFFDVLAETVRDREVFLRAVYGAFRWVIEKAKERG
ncbi:MAG: hypothetical protein KC549_02450 [Myxococcales bacterium]|nr:hypothetical protein [Myxococcales bacterium]MCB9550072.1 hypothetical protein [Myxococcales bacterium]